MSWTLREYFVITEYLIKEHILPFFDGITMADDQTTITRKMLDRTKGQGDKKIQDCDNSQPHRLREMEQPPKRRSKQPRFSSDGSVFGLPAVDRTHARGL